MYSDDDDLIPQSQLAHEPVVATYDQQSGSKVINDPVHGHFRLPEECIRVIDTPEFQRLRDVKQLGTSYYVFPGACHNRFEHSLGVCHLAEHEVVRLQKMQGAELGITSRDIKHVSLAGLCHDLGHAPFSHVFDHEFLPRVLGNTFKGEETWSHEQMSGQLLEQIIDTQYIDDDLISKDDCRKITDLIRSSCNDHTVKSYNEKHFLREIVANGRNSIDVDKFDYLARDCYYCGVQASCDFRRIMPFMRVIDDTICFKASEIWNIYEIFHTRASLHRRVYTHKVAKAIEYMVVDAMTEANEHFAIVEKAMDPKTFIQLDDSILKRIEHCNPSDDDPKLRKAKAIVDRIRRRDLYKYVNEFCVPTEMLQEWKKVTSEQITTCQVNSKFPGIDLRPEDIVIQNMKIDWAMKDKNPVDHVYFFQDARSDEKFTIPKEKVSTMLPEVFQERKVRLFVKDPKKFDAAATAFEEFQKKVFGQKNWKDQGQIASTPPRTRKPPLGATHSRIRRSEITIGNAPKSRKRIDLGSITE